MLASGTEKREISLAMNRSLNVSAVTGEPEVPLPLLLARAAAGDRDALGELYRRFHPRVLGLCRYILGSPAEAEDTASDVFARLGNAMKTYDSSLPFPRWLLSVASHQCVDQLRRRRVEQRLFEPAEAEALPAAVAEPSPLQSLISSESRERVRQAIAELPERYRVPLTLRYYSELTYDEIGAVLRTPRANVATLIFRAKKQLRTALAEPPREKQG
jgi:RNA polymerase sigma-70 factor, ECF subfamily